MLAQTSWARPISASLADSSRTSAAGRAERPPRPRASAARRRAAHAASARRRRARHADRRREGHRRHRRRRPTIRRCGAARRASARAARPGDARSRRAARAARRCAPGGASAARAATRSTPSAPLPGSLDAMARQYIEAMLATRWPRPWHAAEWATAIASRGPSLCAVCRGWGRGRVCASCLDRFAAPVPRCRRCALPLAAPVAVCGTCLTDATAVRRRPRRGRLPAAVGPAGDRVQVPWRARPRPPCSPTPIVRRAARRAAPRASACCCRCRWPPARWRERGYNQAWELARRRRATARRRRRARLLLRMRETAHQLALPLAERAGNVRGAFAVEPRRRAELRGRHVAVVDDVMTTGSTAAEIAGVLEQAGAARSRSGCSRGRRARATPSAATRRGCSTSSWSQPEIPPNTGNVIRLAANTGCRLHLVEPLGFAMDDPLLRRAGLDYHEYVDVRRHASWPALRSPRAGPIRAGCSPSRRDGGRASPRSPSSPATGSSSAPRSSGLPSRCGRRFAASADRAPADARRPAQPEPEQRRRGRGVRGLAPERLRRVGLTVASTTPVALRAASAARARPRAALAPPSSTCDDGGDDRHLDAARVRHAQAPSARCARPRRRGRARPGCRASGWPSARREADVPVARQLAGRGQDQVAEPRQAHEGFGVARRARRRGASSRPGRA